MTWFQIWTICWQVSVFLTPLLVGATFLWLKANFVTKSEAVVERNRVDGVLAAAQSERDRRWELVRDQLSDHHGRIKLIEVDVAKPPSRHTLNNAISVMQGGLAAVEKSVGSLAHQVESQSADLRRQMETLNSYLHTVIEKHLA